MVEDDDGYLEEDLKPFRDDGDATELVVFAFGNNCEVEIYSEPKPLTGHATFMEKVREKMKGNICDEEVDNSSDSSSESVKGIHFNDGVDEMQGRPTHVDVDDACRSEPSNNALIT